MVQELEFISAGGDGLSVDRQHEGSGVCPRNADEHGRCGGGSTHNQTVDVSVPPNCYKLVLLFHTVYAWCLLYVSGNLWGGPVLVVANGVTSLVLCCRPGLVRGIGPHASVDFDNPLFNANDDYAEDQTKAASG